jgi:hypothetical protein
MKMTSIKYFMTVFNYKHVYSIILKFRFYIFKIISNSNFDCSVNDIRCLNNPNSLYYHYTKIGLNTPICCKNHLVEISKVITNIFEKSDIDYFAFFGTLLGIIRDNLYIPWDTDIDLILNISDKDKVIKILSENKIFDRYFVEIDENKITINYSTINKSHLDLFFFNIKNNKLNFIDKDLFDSIDFNLEYFYPIKYDTFESFSIRIPNNPEIILNNLYGEFCLLIIEKKYEII